ncbi:MAG: hypothetical protein ABI619_02640 [Betaproteobacteria bacterium]
MKQILRSLVLGWMLLWLAGSGMLAAAMPMCAHTPGQHGDHSSAVQQDGQAIHQHGTPHASHVANPHDGTTEANGDAKSVGLLGFVCDNCDLCHLASSIIPVGSPSNALFIAGRTFPAGADVTFPIRFPEQPQRVPLARRA